MSKNLEAAQFAGGDGGKDGAVQETAAEASLEHGPRRPSLGSLLVKAGVASDESVKKAIAEGVDTGERLGEIVVRKGWATDELIAELLAEQWRLPFSPAGELRIDPSAIGGLPLAEAEALGALPIGFDRHRLLLAIVEPSRDLIAAVRERIGEASFLVVARSTFDSLLETVTLAAEAPAPVVGDGDGDETVAADEPRDLDAIHAEVGSGSLADAALQAIEAATNEFERIHREVAALGKSLALARAQLAEQEDELEAAAEDREHDAETIRALEAEVLRLAALTSRT